VTALPPKPAVAVVGTGFGCLTHVRALQAAGFDVRALVGRDAAKTAARAERFGVPHALTSLDEALALPGVDAVTIATPPDTHGPIALRVIEAGRHVLCEKPLALDTREAETMLAAAETAGVVHLLGAEFRWAAGQATMARTIAEGRIGSPRLATFLLHIPLLADPTAEVPAWWSDRQRGGGWLGAHASHVIDQVRDTLGEFAAVSAALPQLVERPWTAEDSYTVHFRLCAGVEGIMQSSSSDYGPLLLMSRVVGSTATIWTEGDTVKVADNTGTHTVDPPDDLLPQAPDPPPADLLQTHYDMLHATGIDMGPWVRMASAFRELMLGKTPAGPRPATFADGVALMRVVDAIRRSDQDQDWVAC
jgi:predicted dehydrogenase